MIDALCKGLATKAEAEEWSMQDQAQIGEKTD
jgi:hypothetical protein